MKKRHSKAAGPPATAMHASGSISFDTNGRRRPDCPLPRCGSPSPLADIGYSIPQPGAFVKGDCSSLPHRTACKARPYAVLWSSYSAAPEVTSATEQDLDEIFACLERFIADCWLLDRPDREHTRKTIGAFRVTRENGRIVSMAKLSPSTGADVKLTAVYARDEARGKGCARKVVNAAKNEILSMGKVATLNVDQHNPASNHLYASLGFRRVFSQGEYRRAD